MPTLFQVLHGDLFRASSWLLLEDLDLADHAVFQHGHVVEEVEGLEDHADLRPVGRGPDALAGEDVLIVEANFPAGGGLQAG